MSSLRKASPLLIAFLLGAVLPSISLHGAESPVMELGGRFVIETDPGWIYQPMVSSDMEQWKPYGEWIFGDGEAHEVLQAFDGKPVYIRVDQTPVEDLSSQLEGLRTAQQLPALAVVVIQNGQVSAVGATGTRRHGIDAPVTLRDHWHHGSMTKSMTATLAALLVEDGFIDWSTTLGEVFPDKAASMVSGWSEVTLKHLLSNSSGAPGDLSTNGIWNKLWYFEGTPRQGRRLLLDEVTAYPLRFASGTGYEYSNAGFALAGLMLEEVTGNSWEFLMAERFFPAMGMSSGGFGVPATPRHLDHPVGHSGSAANPVIHDPDRNADNPPAIGPAATVHAAILDMARYAQTHLRGARGEGESPLSQASWNTLHSRAYGNDYALGWLVLNRPWAGGDALQHTGSNLQWFTNVWIAPEINWACVISTNFGGNDVFNKVDQVVIWALDTHGP